MITLLINQAHNNLPDNTIEPKLDKIILYKILALINSKINAQKENLVVAGLIRAHPFCYSPNTTQDYYKRWIIRYWDIYNIRLHDLKEEQKNIITNEIKSIEANIGTTLSKKFVLARNLLYWFLIENKFSTKNDASFYIKRQSFPSWIELINKMALSLEEFESFFNNAIKEDSTKKRIIEPFNQKIIKFFDYPIIKIDDNTFYILDLKYLIENTCFCVRYQNITTTSPPYGRMLEKYFKTLLPKIFGSLRNLSEHNEPDAILEIENYIIIFEFTTEYYSISCLNSNMLLNFEKSLNKILFNPGKKADKTSEKKDPGKFIKLETYFKKYEKNNQNKRIVPVLVTEKNIGDYCLLNELDNILTKGIKKNNLENLGRNPPLIISLDDLEIYWSLIDDNNPDKAAKEFIKSIYEWQKLQKKGEYLYNFSFFLERKYGNRAINKEYHDFFNLLNITDESIK